MASAPNPGRAQTLTCLAFSVQPLDQLFVIGPLEREEFALLNMHLLRS
jgi:hypothetical protein